MEGEAIIIAADGVITQVPLTEPPTLEQYHEWVGGHIELVPYFSRWKIGMDIAVTCVAFCNEEGKLEGLPLNALATHIWHAQHPTDDTLVGAVVVIIGDEALLKAL